MTQERVVRVAIHYNDAGCIERVVAAFRKLLIDVNWIWGRRVGDTYETYLGVEDHPNVMTAILNLSKTVGVEFVEVLLDAKIERYAYVDGNLKRIDVENQASKNINRASRHFIVYIPVYTKIAGYAWGEKYGEDI